MSAHKALNDFYNQRPARPIDGVALLFNGSGELLILKPTYKDGWMLVGGCSEQGETVLEALQREIREEIGLNLQSERFTFLGLRDVTARDGRNAYVQVYFKAILLPEEITRIKWQEDEIAQHQFVRVADLEKYADQPRMKAVVALLNETGAAYLLNEQVTVRGA